MHIILGGGIAGCYIGLQLLEKNEPFIILEKSKPYESRGKQISIFISEEETLELGSSVIHSNQPNIYDMIKRLGLLGKLEIENAKMKAVYVYPGLSNQEAKKRFRFLKNKVKQEALRSFSIETLDQLSIRILSIEDYHLLQGCWEDWYEVSSQNAYFVFHSISIYGDWYHMKGGLQQLLDKSLDVLSPYIKFDHELTELRYKKTKRNNGKWLITCKNQYEIESASVFFTLNSNASRKVKITDSRFTHYLQLGQYIKCMRAYVILKRPIHTEIVSISGPVKLDYSGIDETQGWPSKYTLQINPRIWLFSYPDGELVDLLSKDIDSLLAKWIYAMNKLKKIKMSSPLTVEDVEKVEVSIWKDAYTILTPFYYTSIMGNKFQHGFYEKGLVCTTLPTPDHQAWMEGSLITI